MHYVEQAYEVHPSRTELLGILNPRNIIEFSEVYEIKSQKKGGSQSVLMVNFKDNEVKISFTSFDSGYTYEFSESNLFEERLSKIMIKSDDPTIVTVESRFTVNSFWSFIFDRIISRGVQREHDVLVENLLAEANQNNI